MGGLFDRRPRRRQAAPVAGGLAVMALAATMLMPTDARAQADDISAIEAISKTRLAYVLTGDSSIDSISRAGMEGLSRFLRDKTALDPGQPAGIDLADDELA